MLPSFIVDIKGDCKVGDFGLATSSLSVDPSNVSASSGFVEADMTLGTLCGFALRHHFVLMVFQRSEHACTLPQKCSHVDELEAHEITQRPTCIP